MASAGSGSKRTRDGKDKERDGKDKKTAVVISDDEEPVLGVQGGAGAAKQVAKEGGEGPLASGGAGSKRARDGKDKETAAPFPPQFGVFHQERKKIVEWRGVNFGYEESWEGETHTEGCCSDYSQYTIRMAGVDKDTVIGRSWIATENHSFVDGAPTKEYVAGAPVGPVIFLSGGGMLYSTSEDGRPCAFMTTSGDGDECGDEYKEGQSRGTARPWPMI